MLLRRHHCRSGKVLFLIFVCHFIELTYRGYLFLFCRKCGQIFCYKCAPKKVLTVIFVLFLTRHWPHDFGCHSKQYIESSGKKYRICVPCLKQYNLRIRKNRPQDPEHEDFSTPTPVRHSYSPSDLPHTESVASSAASNASRTSSRTSNSIQRTPPPRVRRYSASGAHDRSPAHGNFRKLTSARFCCSNILTLALVMGIWFAETLFRAIARAFELYSRLR